MNRRRRAIGAYTLAALVFAAVIVVRHRPAAEPVDGYPADYYTETAAPTEPPAPAVTGASTTTGPRSTTAATTEEARTGPAISALPADVDVVAYTAVAFLHGWVLRGSWDQRNDALKKWTTADYVAHVAYIDPDLVGLPAGNDIRVDTAHVTISGAGGATVPASVDGLAVVVFEVRTATGWVVDNHDYA